MKLIVNVTAERVMQPEEVLYIKMLSPEERAKRDEEIRTEIAKFFHQEGATSVQVNSIFHEN